MPPHPVSVAPQPRVFVMKQRNHRTRSRVRGGPRDTHLTRKETGDSGSAPGNAWRRGGTEGRQAPPPSARSFLPTRKQMPRSRIPLAGASVGIASSGSLVTTPRRVLRTRSPGSRDPVALRPPPPRGAPRTRQPRSCGPRSAHLQVQSPRPPRLGSSAPAQRPRPAGPRPGDLQPAESPPHPGAFGDPATSWAV